MNFKESKKGHKRKFGMRKHLGTMMQLCSHFKNNQQKKILGLKHLISGSKRRTYRIPVTGEENRSTPSKKTKCSAVQKYLGLMQHCELLFFIT